MTSPTQVTARILLLSLGLAVPVFPLSVRSQTEFKVRSTTTEQAIPDVAAVPFGGAGPSTLVDNKSTDIERQKSYKELNLRVSDLETKLVSLDGEKRELINVTIFTRGNERGLDAEKLHSEMLGKLTAAGKLLSAYQELRKGFESEKEKSSGVMSNNVSSDLKQSFDKRIQEIQAGIASIDGSIAEVTGYRNDINNQLIEDVHRYQIKNDFRFRVGGFWLVALVIICAALLYLVYIGVLKAGESSSLQLFAMILIIFVIALFGMADVMGENGVTGLLAAIAGYILGKSSGSNSRDQPQTPRSPGVGSGSGMGDEVGSQAPESAKIL